MQKHRPISFGQFALALIAGLVVFGALYGADKRVDEQNNFEPYRAELSGEFVCLPWVDTRMPQTTECAFGLRTQGGEYYAIDFNLMSQDRLGLTVGDRLRAWGLVTPVERLSTDHWRKYPIRGIFSVTDSLDILR